MLETEAQLKELLRRYDRLRCIKDPKEVFAQRLLGDPASWFVELGDVGLVSLGAIVPGGSAIFQFHYWDERLSRNREEAVKSALAAGFKLFNLNRVTAFVDHRNRPVYDFLKRIGFKVEGKMREAAPHRGNVFIFGILKREIPPCLLPPMISGV